MKRDEVWLARLEPVAGSEIGKTRPCVIISPDEANQALRTVIVAPLTSVRRPWPSRVPVRFGEQDGDCALDQLRTLDKRRLFQKVGALSPAETALIRDRLIEMFAP